jgi:hypothetical protein
MLKSNFLCRLNSREVFCGHGINEEDSIRSQPRVGTTAFSSSGGSTNPAAPNPAVKSKSTLNIGVTDTIDMQQERNKIMFEYDTVGLFLSSCIILIHVSNPRIHLLIM